MKQLGRFLRLERARKDSEHEMPAAPSRFSTLEEVRESPPPAPHATPGLQRFAPVPTPEPELELETPDASEPFVRCPDCGADSARHATVCRQCEASLDSEAVRAFNEKLWLQMRSEREAEDARERETLRTRGVGTSVPDEAFAAELAAREAARRALEAPSYWGAPGWGWGRGLGGTGRGFSLLTSVVVVPLLLAFLGRGVGGRWAVLFVALGVLALFAMRRRR